MSELVIVTGLPRSGTSLVMSMLQAGGMDLASDDGRPADEHNPRGYFEHSSVLQLAQKSDWLGQCGGQAIKILYRQLEFVPVALAARILVLERDLEEVVASQKLMLPAQQDGWDWLDLFRREQVRFRSWLASQKWPFLVVTHARLLQEPDLVAMEIRDFLERPLNLPAMVAQVDPGLYRNRRC